MWLGASASAGPEATRLSLDRLGEVLALRLEDGSVKRDDLVPAVLVGASAAFVETEPWFSTRVIEVLHGALGNGTLRLCEACGAPRTIVEDGALLHQTGAVSLDEVRRLDDLTRGAAPPARAAIWVDEHPTGVSIRVVALATGQILFAQNIDPFLVESRNTQRVYTMAEELERRVRGDGLTQAFVDLVVYPGQHISLDWTDQWGATNANLTGITMSFYDPVIGLGICHYGRVPILDSLVGGKGIVSLPTAIARGVGTTGPLLDPMITLVGVVRVPFARSNYGVTLSLSTNAEIGVGLSLLNISLLPVIP